MTLSGKKLIENILAVVLLVHLTASFLLALVTNYNPPPNDFSSCPKYL